MLSYLGAIVAAVLPLLVVSAQAAQLYTKPCPLIDANYPAPSKLATSNYVADAVNSTRSQILSALSGSSRYGTYDANTTAFSLEVYSVHGESPLFTYHHTPEALISQRTVGVEKVDSDTIYRLGSGSKLWTVFIYLIAAGDKSWNHPITDYVPELAAIARKDGNVEGSTDYVDWTSVTVGALASQIAGIARDAAYSGELAEMLDEYEIPNPGFDAHSTCGNVTTDMFPCNRTAFFEDFSKQHPVFSPFMSPVYSNAAYQILSYALEDITGQSMVDLFQQHLVEPLNLTSTYYTVPPGNVTSTGIIPQNATASWWNANALEESPAGGYYSSINDMRKVGTSMLRSSQLTPAQTRRWMKPHSFLSDRAAAVGAPWEIMLAHDNPVTWLYTKTGNFGDYASTIALLSDFNIGFSVLTAGTDASDAVAAGGIFADTLADTWVPAARSAAKAEAEAVYANTYIDKNTNSTMVVSTKPDNPGLVVTKWTCGGINVIGLLAENVMGVSTDSVVMHLYSTGLNKTNSNGIQVSWRAVFESFPQPLDPGPFSQNCASWDTVNGYTYGGVGFDEFLFTVDRASGKAVALEPRVLSEALAAVNGVEMVASK